MKIRKWKTQISVNFNGTSFSFKRFSLLNILFISLVCILSIYFSRLHVPSFCFVALLWVLKYFLR
jgi:hypothetical protein